MPGLFAYLAAGAAEGVGSSIAEEGKAKREHMLRMLESDSLLDRQMKLEDYKTSKDTNLVVGEDGNTYNVQGGKASRFEGPDGKPMNIVTGTKDQGTSETKFMEYLIKNGVAKDHKEALEIVQTGKAKGISPLDVEKAVNDRIKTNFPAGGASKEEEEAIRTEVMTRLGLAPKDEGPGSKTENGMPAPKTRADYEKLPSGTSFVDPNGQVRIKP